MLLGLKISISALPQQIGVGPYFEKYILCKRDCISSPREKGIFKNSRVSKYGIPSLSLRFLGGVQCFWHCSPSRRAYTQPV